MPTFLLIRGAYCQGSIWAETAAALRDNGHRAEGSLQVSGDLETVRQALCADIDAERFATEVYPRYVLTSVSSMTAPSTAPQPTHPTTYIICEHDQVIPPQAQEAMSAAADHVIRLASPHAAMLSMPGHLASVLGGVA